MKKRVIFRFDGEVIGEIHHDETGALVATTDRVRWITGQSIDIGDRRIQPGEDDFVGLLPVAYAGGRFRAELVDE